MPFYDKMILSCVKHSLCLNLIRFIVLSPFVDSCFIFLIIFTVKLKKYIATVVKY